jgi:hypothetical protein
MQFNDLINGLFELVGGILNWMNVVRLFKDKDIKGVYYPAWIFFAVWGLWNLYYYPSLDQWMSFVGGLIITSANVVWVILALYYTKAFSTK